MNDEPMNNDSERCWCFNIFSVSKFIVGNISIDIFVRNPLNYFNLQYSFRGTGILLTPSMKYFYCTNNRNIRHKTDQILYYNL